MGRQDLGGHKAAGLDLRKLEGKKRRALEKLSAEMVRCAHRAIFANTTCRATSSDAPLPTYDPNMDVGEPSSP